MDKILKRLQEAWSRIEEMPEWADEDKAVGDNKSFNKKHHGYNTDMYDKFSLKREGDYEWHWYRYIHVEGIIKVDIVHNGNLVGRFEYAKRKPFYRMDLASVSSEHRGKGLALKTYKMILDRVETLESSQTLTGEKGDKGSFHIWQKLSKEYNSYLKQDYKLKKVDSFTEDMMNSYGTTFVISKKELISEDNI